jgi:uncharacterized damage-inducible protein DinB
MATDLDVLRDLYRYNLRKLKEYQRLIWKLPVKERHRDRGSTFPSLVDIYLHLLDDYRFWLIQAYSGKDVDGYPLGIRLSPAQAVRATKEVERVVMKLFRGLRPRDMTRRIYVAEDRRSYAVRTILMQLLQGDLQHKGELNALLWQMDVTPPRVNLRLLYP